MTLLRHLSRLSLLTLGTLSTAAYAQPHTAAAAAAWQACQVMTDAPERLACFDQWALTQNPIPSGTVPQPQALGQPASAWEDPAPAAATAALDMADTTTPSVSEDNCRNPAYSTLSRFYELERATDCGTLRLRGYQPQSVSLTFANHINEQPGNASRGVAPTEDYQSKELRIQLSIRSKLAGGLLTPADAQAMDSLWVGYSQLSFWQVFNDDNSRPFRTTDHKPEIFYVYPTQMQLPFNWRLRYSGIGFMHHSNGQSDPLSRSWNQLYLMAGAELDDRWSLQLKTWRRIPERDAYDDNPDILRYWGRAEAQLFWNIDADNTVGLTARGSLGRNYGSGRLEWMRTLGQSWSGNRSNLRLHLQLFSGYGESLIDYNYKRTSLSVGLSLLDF